MAYTQMYTCGPSHVLPTIGSLADSLNRTEDNPFFDFFCSTPEAESIRATFGEVAYQQYVEQALVSQQARAARAAEISKELASKRSTIQRWITKIRYAYTETN
ncbi:hypothetical protein GTR04_4722 [Trichophyton interdigitale]|uniref:Uncharacterized protein n=1 Tax=Trichophyton interdigitale TaxID=101480 RepID=A0A9P4YMI8_9EURO|nr:hypothetical protein GY631_1168 [Trichophyton interdigitale]KAF3900234.1 hypothetical protein GY632_0891 [Trichophyton interdigitale]KAG8207879.1 hypothetical protein GTR04_4722 [Trichophyton interdigitale]